MSTTLTAAYVAGTDRALSQLGLKTANAAFEALSHHVDDLGLALMAAPYAASLLGHGLSKARNKKVRALGKSINKHMGTTSAFGKSHARELLGLSLVAPSINRLVTKGLGAGLRKLPKLPKFPKLGMQLEFNNQADADQHASRKETIGGVAGFAGNLAGSAVGTAAGTAMGGPAGGFAGEMAGGEIGEALTAKPAQLAYDVQHDIKQRSGARFNDTMGQLNQAAGMPAGRTPMNSTPGM